MQRCKSAQGNVERLGYDPDCVAGTAPHYIVDRSRADRRDPNLAVCTVRSGAAALPIKRRPRPIQKVKLSFRSRIVAVSLNAFTARRHSHKTRCVSRALLPDQPGITRRSRSLPIEAPSHHRDPLAVLSEDAGWIVREWILIPTYALDEHGAHEDSGDALASISGLLACKLNSRTRASPSGNVWRASARLSGRAAVRPFEKSALKFRL